MKCMVQVIGPSGSGKTSSIVEALDHLAKLGYRVGVLKHTHHNIDLAEKDTWKYIEQGNSVFSVIYKGSGERVGVFLRDVEDLRGLLELLSSYTNIDALIIEGFKDLDLGEKIYINRKENIRAIASRIIDYIINCLNK